MRSAPDQTGTGGLGLSQLSSMPTAISQNRLKVQTNGGLATCTLWMYSR